MIWLLLACGTDPPALCTPEHLIQLPTSTSWSPLPEGPMALVDGAGQVTREDLWTVQGLAVDKRARVIVVPPEGEALAVCRRDGSLGSIPLHRGLVADELGLRVHVEPGAVHVSGPPQPLVEDIEREGGSLDLPCCSAADLATLSATIGRIKDEYPDQEQVTVSADGAVAWGTLIATMDAARANPGDLRDGKPRELYPWILWLPPDDAFSKD